MTTAQEVTDYALSLVGQKVTVPTNSFGGQCVALIDHIMQHFTDFDMAYVNAKDCLVKAGNQGLEVIYNDPSNPTLIPQSGDFFVMQFGAGDPFGHIGVCISADQNGMQTVEQNIDGYRDDNANGINDQLEEGGGGYTRNNYRNYSNVIGWFRLPYTDTKTDKDKTEDDDMFTISAEGRGIALITGGVFFSLLDQKDPVAFWEAGAKHVQVSAKTFDNFQTRSNLGKLDDDTVNRLVNGLKK